MIKICIQIEERKHMSNVEVVVTGSIGAGQAPLTIDNTTDQLPAMTVGVVLPPTQIAQVKGGVPPIVFTFDQDIDGSKGLLQKSPDDLAALGLAISEDGNGNITIAGTPTNTSAVSFGIVATDAAGAQVAAARTARRIG